MYPIVRTNRNIGGKLNMTVYGGLNYIRGNKKPHFSITAVIKEGHREYISGCCHNEILRVYPELSDVVSMHLSDIDGEPVHANENGYYWLTAVQGTNQYERDTVKDYVDILSQYVRVSREDARALSDRIRDKGEFARWVESQKPRWKQESKKCIEKHNLVLFGDYYKES